MASHALVFRGGLYYVLYIGTTDYVIYDILSYTVSRGNIAYTGLDGHQYSYVVPIVSVLIYSTWVI